MCGACLGFIKTGLKGYLLLWIDLFAVTFMDLNPEPVAPLIDDFTDEVVAVCQGSAANAHFTDCTAYRCGYADGTDQVAFIDLCWVNMKHFQLVLEGGRFCLMIQKAGA